MNLLAHIRNEKAKEIWNYFENQQSDRHVKTEDEYSEIVKTEDEYSELDESDKQFKPDDHSSELDESDKQVKPDDDSSEQDDPIKKDDDSSDQDDPIKTDADSSDQDNIMGIHILSEIAKFTSNLDPNIKYTDSSYVELYKLLQSMN